MRIGPQLMDGLSAGRSPPRRKRKGVLHFNAFAGGDPLQISR